MECELIVAPPPSPFSGIELEGGGPLGGLTPQEIRAAYNLPEHGGAGNTIGIVDGPADPHAEEDMNFYRRQFGLSECTEASGCFRQVNLEGKPKKPAEQGSWIPEISLDLDMVSAACQECHIILLETLGASQLEPLLAQEEVLKLGATVITNSWNFGFETNNPANSKVNCTERACVDAEEEVIDDPAFEYPNVPVFFAGGDYGYAMRYPAASSKVISVGGTTLRKEPGNARGWVEEPWFNSKIEVDAKGRGGGSGCSVYEPKPPWQTDKACTKRMMSDVAADANWEKSPVSTYNSFVSGGWVNNGGTSLSSPLVAAIWALSTSYSKNLPALGAEAFYKDPAALFAITSGSNGTCTPPAEDEYWCTAMPGYNGPVGNGTPNGPLTLGAAPALTAKSATAITATGASLRGTVNPNGLETIYHFEYGPTTAYGTNAPIPSNSAGAGASAQEVSAPIGGLQPESTYHFRLTATNATGTTNGVDGTFTTLPLPTITNVQANAGPTAGGTLVNISGANLAGAMSVSFGSTPAASFTVDSPTLVTATSPAGSGPVDVSVGTPAGTSVPTAADSFIYRRARSASAWGENKSGQFGNGTTTNSALPLPLGGSSEVASLAGGSLHSLALAGGAVLAAGNNEAGQLGNGTALNSSVPVSVCAVGEAAPCTKHLGEVTALAGGKSHSLALLKSGSVAAWGYGTDGELGNGTNLPTDVPVMVSNVNEATAIAAGSFFNMALLKNGTVLTWGENKHGQLGDDKTENANKPVPVCELAEFPCKPENDLNEVIAISARGAHALALLRNGTVMAWGQNKHGELGNGGTTDSPIPVQVSALSGATAVAAGEADGYALRGNGTVEAWGEGEAGQLGNGATANSLVPVQVSKLSEATAIAAGSAHALALLRNGTAMAWGQNDSGQLGNNNSAGPESCTRSGGTVACSDTPLQVSNMGEVTQLAGGAGDSLAVAASPSPGIALLEPAEGLPAGGTAVTITGSNFVGASEVKFGSTAAQSFSVHSPTSISAVSPAGGGIVNVTVTTPAGVSPLSTLTQFSYVIPTLREGLPFKTPVQLGKQLSFAVPSEGAGFSFGPLKVSGAVGETAKLHLESKPAFERLERGEYQPTGQGVVSSVEAFTAGGERMIGPVPVVCEPPSDVVIAELPIVSAPGSGRKPFSTTFNAECVNWPRGWNILGIAKVTLTGNVPENVGSGGSVEVTGAKFAVTLPLEWSEWLYALGGREARGTSSSRAASSIHH
jgi:alpha-tubulin suppressor-like RCC1 family protein